MSTKLSESYAQLAKVFDSLEQARFEENKDFGQDVTGTFKWFISPAALYFLEKRSVEHWTCLKHNERFCWSLQQWHGFSEKGADISLV